MMQYFFKSCRFKKIWKRFKGRTGLMEPLKIVGQCRKKIIPAPQKSLHVAGWTESWMWTDTEENRDEGRWQKQEKNIRNGKSLLTKIGHVGQWTDCRRKRKHWRVLGSFDIKWQTYLLLSVPLASYFVLMYMHSCCF